MSAQAHDADVLIAGAGMAGATFALGAARAGLKPLLIDPLPFEVQTEAGFDGRASAIAFACLRQWRVLGAAGRLEPHAGRIDEILVTDGRTPGAASAAASPAFLHFAAEEIADRCDGEPLGWMIENRRIRSALAETVREAEIAVLAPAAVAAVEVGAAAVLVRLKDGRCLSAPLVVGAEGRSSVVREAAGIGVVGWDYGQSGVVATVRMEAPHGNVAHEYFLPSGPFAILPLTENRASLVWTEPPKRAQALKTCSPEAFEAHLERRFGEFLGGLEVLGPRFVYPLGFSLAERMSGPRTALLGDSAHGMHPIAGQGLNSGLKDAAALAEVLAEAARLGEDIGAEAVLERYARWRRFDNVMLMAATDGFTRLFSNDLPLVRQVRDAGLALVNRIGPARRFFMEEAGGATGDLPRLLRGEAL
jgi:2-octaprenyl-6-methoxyphenol hydroxylase